MEKREKDSGNNPGKFVSRVEHQHVVSDVSLMKLALFGEDGRGGMVKDVQTIKSATSIFKSVALPLIVAVISSLLTAGLLLNL